MPTMPCTWDWDALAFTPRGVYSGALGDAGDLSSCYPILSPWQTQWMGTI